MGTERDDFPAGTLDQAPRLAHHQAAKTADSTAGPSISRGISCGAVLATRLVINSEEIRVERTYGPDLSQHQ